VSARPGNGQRRLPEPANDGEAIIRVAGEQLWMERTCPGIAATGLNLTIPDERTIVENAPPALSFYANFGDARSIRLGGHAVSLPARRVSLISFNDEEPVSELWHAGQKATTAGVILSADLAESLPERDAEGFHRFLRKWFAQPGAHVLPASSALDGLARCLMARPATVGWIAALHRQQLALAFMLEAIRAIDGQSDAVPYPQDGPCSGRLDDVAARLAESGNDLPDLIELARIAGMSISVLRRRFKARFGETLTDYARRHRLEHALVLLETNALPIAEIAWRAGYSDTANFSTAFRRHFGFTPGSVRGAHGAC